MYADLFMLVLSLSLLILISGMKKGNWYYENQVLMFVIMWKHNNKQCLFDTGGLRLGRLWIWYDSAWMHHGFAYILYRFWLDLTRNTKALKRRSAKLNLIRINARLMFKRWFFKKPLIKDLFSLMAYLKLNRAGFRITNSVDETGNFEINRFWWKNRVIRDFPDIDRSYDRYNTIRDGHVESLKSGDTWLIEDEWK